MRLFKTLTTLLLYGLLPSALALGSQTPGPVAPPALSVRITSPLGRTGLSGTIRLVARVTAPPERAPFVVRFFVDGVAVGEDATGPGYAADWVDENPFEARKIAVEVVDAAGATARDAIDLAPFEFIETAEVSSVLVEATVLDADKRRVEGMGPSGFVLAEDGVPQLLDAVQPERTPALYALLIDSSFSMSRRMDFVREAALRLTKFLRPKDRVLVAPFSRTLGAITGPTDDMETVADAVSSIEARGGTAIGDSLAAVSKVLANHDGRREVVLITDGYDEHSATAMEEALREVKNSATTVYVVGIGGVAGISLKGERVLREIAKVTGGLAFFPFRGEDLLAAYDRVASDVHTRYLLSYTPTNQKRDGTYRKIEVRAADPTYTVRARDGYFAPKPPPIRPSLEFTIVGTDRQFHDVSAEDLVIVEDGVEQVIDTFHEAVAPVSIVLALDESGSMRRVADGVKEAARTFVRAVRPEDKLALIVFSDRTRLAHDLSTDRSGPLGDIDEYKPSGGTALFDAVTDALLRLEPVEGRRAVVVMTDGRDENNAGTGPGSRTTIADALALVRRVESAVFAIGLGSNVDREGLTALAEASGGEAHFPDDIAALQEDYTRVVEALRRRYVIGYTSTNGARDGAWRKVEIRCRIPSVNVMSRGGYSAPEK